jgi:hypothetical protein
LDISMTVPYVFFITTAIFTSILTATIIMYNRTNLNRHGSQGRGASSREGQDVGRSSALRVDVHPADDRGEHIHQWACTRGAAAEYSSLLAVRGFCHIGYYLHRYVIVGIIKYIVTDRSIDRSIDR